MRRAPPEQVAEARELWIARVGVEEIGRQVGCSPVTVYYWRQKYRWPARQPANRGHPPAVRALAKSLWVQGVPRRDIAGLCGVNVSTVNHWRWKYHWRRRVPGHSYRSWEVVYRAKRRPTARSTDKPVVITATSGPTLWRCDCLRLNLMVNPRCASCGTPNPIPCAS